jgi:D-alanyl-D-alanine carboxypeptidase/D-alanyl-D-alanine-endopeptidase (penicillin-binding protein 4)
VSASGRPTTALLLIALCAALARPVGLSSRSLDSPEQLARDLGRFFGAPEVDHVQWGVEVTSLRDGRTLYSLNGTRFMVPGSNQKLLTLAAAAARLGWGYRFTTRVLATGPIGADGTLDGSLVIVGDGDPTINPRHPDRWVAFDVWAAILRQQGVRAIAGDIIGDDNAFAEPGWGIGWAWDNLQYGYGAPTGALQYHENQVEVMVGPGMTQGTRAIITVSPPGSGIAIDNAVTTAAPGLPTTIDFARVPGRERLEVRGHIAAGARPVTQTASVGNPTELYVEAFRDTLRRQGIAVAGAARDIDDLTMPPSRGGSREIIVDQSPPLSEIADPMMRWSRNGYAETLLFAMAAPGEPATSERGLDAMRETFAAWGISPDAYLPRDGSGLSRYDYVSAAMLVQLLRRVAADPALDAVFRSTLPVAGQSGTLANRMNGTPAQGRVAAKTGSLSNVRGVSGYATTVDGEPLAFAILANNYRVPTREIDAIVDAALLRIVEFRR